MLEQHPRLPVTDQGVVVPKVWFGEASMVEVHLENGRLTLLPVAPESTAQKPAPYDPDDPIWKWGQDPVDIDLTDGAVNHDKYLYDDPHRLNG